MTHMVQQPQAECIDCVVAAFQMLVESHGCLYALAVNMVESVQLPKNHVVGSFMSVLSGAKSLIKTRDFCCSPSPESDKGLFWGACSGRRIG